MVTTTHRPTRSFTITVSRHRICHHAHRTGIAACSPTIHCPATVHSCTSSNTPRLPGPVFIHLYCPDALCWPHGGSRQPQRPAAPKARRCWIRLATDWRTPSLTHSHESVVPDTHNPTLPGVGINMFQLMSIQETACKSIPATPPARPLKHHPHHPVSWSGWKNVRKS